MTIPWKEFAKLIKSGKYEGGAATSRETDNTFGGPIDEVIADDKGAALAVKPCAIRRDSAWKVAWPEGRLISGFGYEGVAEPHLDEHEVLSYYVYMLGTVHIYPKNHPKAAEILSIGTEVVA